MNWLTVIPSIRTINMAYLEPLGKTDILVIDDSDGGIPKTGWPSNVKVIDYADRKKIMNGADWIVPKKNPSCKGVGLYYCHQEGYDGAILLDDDCDLSVTPRYLDLIPVGRPQRERVTADGSWFNTLSLISPSFYSRGYPYELREEPFTPIEFHSQAGEFASPKFNQGMWSGTPDINGIDKIRNDHVLKSEIPVTCFGRTCDRTVTMRPGQLLPCSIMNVQIHRDLIPAFYQPPDYQLSNGWWIRRHDDVWSAMFLKFIMDEMKETMTVGKPIIAHRKAGDERKEAVAEHCTNLLQPYLERAMRSASRSLYNYGNSAEMAVRFAEKLMLESQVAPPIYRRTIDDYASRAVQWAKLFLGS